MQQKSLCLADMDVVFMLKMPDLAPIPYFIFCVLLISNFFSSDTG